MRTVSEGEGTPFPPLFEEEMGYIEEMLTEGIKYTGDTRKDREMIRQRDRRQQLRQEKYIEALEQVIMAACAPNGKAYINACYSRAHDAVETQIEEEAK